MPQVEPKTINDLPRSERKRFTMLCNERTFLQYVFSYAKLFKLLHLVSARSSEGMAFNDEHFNLMLKECIVAWKEDDAKKLKDYLNNEISNIFTENGIPKTLRYFDAFGRPKDYILMEGVSTSFSQARALPIAVSGIFEWDCPSCKATNFTQSRTNVFCSVLGCKHFEHTTEAMKVDRKLKRTPIAEVKISKSHAMTAEAFQSIMRMATQQTSYVTLQARDVVEDKKVRG